MTTSPVLSHEREVLLQANADFAEQKGKYYLAKLAVELKALKLARGSYVIINVVDGRYVTGATRRAARDEFRRLHPDAIGWACRTEDLPCA